MTFVHGQPVTKTTGEILLGSGTTRQVNKAQALDAQGLITITEIKLEPYTNAHMRRNYRRVAVYTLCGAGETLARELRDA